MAATLTCVKLALSFLPNIEAVTLLTALYGYAFGWLGVASSVIFVCIEPLLYGFGPWFVTYIIYWPSLALVFMLLRKKGVRSRLILTAAALLMTAGFGLLSSLIETAIYLGINHNFFKNYMLYYARGLIFYGVQLVCNLAIFSTLFIYLAEKLEIINRSIDREAE